MSRGALPLPPSRWQFFSAVAKGAKGSTPKGRRCIFVARAVPFRSWREGGTTTTRFLLGAQLHPYLWKKEEREKYIALSSSTPPLKPIMPLDSRQGRRRSFAAAVTRRSETVTFVRSSQRKRRGIMGRVCLLLSKCFLPHK